MFAVHARHLYDDCNVFAQTIVCAQRNIVFVQRNIAFTQRVLFAPEKYCVYAKKYCLRARKYSFRAFYCGQTKASDDIKSWHLETTVETIQYRRHADRQCDSGARTSSYTKHVRTSHTNHDGLATNRNP